MRKRDLHLARAHGGSDSHESKANLTRVRHTKHSRSLGLERDLAYERGLAFI